jgi:uncharacterized protein
VSGRAASAKVLKLTESAGKIALELEFEWDPQKAASNFTKHEISFEEAASVFADPLGRIVGDPRHSSQEERYVLLGLSRDQRLVVVMYTDRGHAIRIISARRATRREKREYEKGPH